MENASPLLMDSVIIIKFVNCVFTNDKVRIFRLYKKRIESFCDLCELFFRATDKRTFGGHRRDMEDKTYRFKEKNITALRREKQNVHDTIRE